MRYLDSFLSVLAHPMAIVGIVGQCMFFSRFLVQWLISERRGTSTIPVVFWYLSMAGGCLMLTYALWRRDPVFSMGQATGLVVYIRNLMLIRRRRGRSDEAQPA
jgi:lipid-A-disaccharide synthase-like uncharacterized protein